MGHGVEGSRQAVGQSAPESTGAAQDDTAELEQSDGAEHGEPRRVEAEVFEHSADTQHAWSVRAVGRAVFQAIFGFPVEAIWAVGRAFVGAVGGAVVGAVGRAFVGVVGGAVVGAVGGAIVGAVGRAILRAFIRAIGAAIGAVV